METLSKGLSARFRSAIKSSTSTDTWNKNCFASQAISLSLTSSISTACIGTKRERDSFHVSLRPLSTTGGRRKERGRRKEQRGSELAERGGRKQGGGSAKKVCASAALKHYKIIRITKILHQITRCQKKSKKKFKKGDFFFKKRKALHETPCGL